MGKIKYYKGDKVGPYHHTFLHRLEDTKKAVFLCGQCQQKTFVARISDVVREDRRSKKSCSCLRNQEKQRYGKYKHLLLKKESKNNHSYGLFLCNICNKNTFYARIDSVKDNNIKLIRIPYWNYDKLSKQYILQLLESTGV